LALVGGVVVLTELTAACEVLGDAIGATDPSLLSGVDCAEMVELLARTEKRSAALRVLAARSGGALWRPQEPELLRRRAVAGRHGRYHNW
jgi:hypothetical protein